MFSQTDTIGVDTDVVRQASVVWQDIGKTYRRALGVFEDAIDAWERECGVFAPANFTLLLESLRGFGVIAGKQAQELAHTAKRFDEMQKEMLEFFGWDEPRQASLAGVRTDYLDVWGHGSDYGDTPVLDAFFRGLGQGLLADIEFLLMFSVINLVIPSRFKSQQEDLSNIFSAICHPLQTAETIIDGLVESFQSPEGVAELIGNLIGGFGWIGGAARGLKILRQGTKPPKTPQPETPTPTKLPTKEQAIKNATRKAEDNLDEVLKINGAKISPKGYFAKKGSKTSRREWYSEDPEATAKEVFDKLSEGGCEYQTINPGKFDERNVMMSDGRTITYRYDSGSGGPTVEINGEKGATYRIPIQKIHFYPEP